VLLFSNPASQASRTNGTVRLSRDEGRTWPVARSLYAGSFAYSCLASVPGGEIGCLFERDGTRKISFARFTLEWLTR
jgi:sialidase-1